MDWPTWMDVEDSVVEIVGLAFMTVKDSHGLVATLLLASPE
jgi:hypothetical protein